ncbi:MAG: glycosyltransferase family 4 protein [Verrucomicrobia bacterium]|nr:glycosyltransferase family 4 protein [Verrucomicrobiota bacterium]
MLSAPIKVLMTADTVGGVWTYALGLCRGLAARGGRVTLVSFGEPASEAQRAEVAELAGITLVETRYKLEWMQDPWAEVDQAGRFLQDLTRAERPDLVHLNGYAHAPLPWPVPVVVVAHSCVFTWWQAVHGCRPPRDQYGEYGRRVRAGLDAADAVVAPTRAMLAGLREAYRWPGEGTVIPNGIDLSGMAPPPKKAVIASAGRLWDPAKGIGLLEKVAPALLWPLVVAGAGREMDGPETRVRNLRLLGKLSPRQTRALFAEASIYAAPVRYEPFGLSILEAAEAGCALVLSDLASLRENWDHAAEFVHPHDPEAWRDALNGLAGDETRRRRLASLAVHRAQRFSNSRMVDGYVELYASLLERSGARPITEGLVA